MSKHFRCGRLLQTRDGRTVKLNLGNGGGTRTCDWSNENMTFDEVHDQLLNVFSLAKEQKLHTKLCDFQCQTLDVKQFPTFADYMKQYGLNRNSTVVYLCTSEMPTEIPKPMEVETHDPIPSTTVTNEPEPVPVVDHQSASSSEYSFIDASQKIMENMRELTHIVRADQVLTKLFEKFCLIHGHVVSIIIPVQKLTENTNELEKTLYLRNLNNIYGIFESTHSLLCRTGERFRNRKQFAVVRFTFFQFYKHIKNLRDRWTKPEQKKKVAPPSDGETQEKKIRSPQNLQNKRNEEQMKIFEPLLSILTRLLRLAKGRALSSFQILIEKIINKLKTLPTTLNLSDHSSIGTARTALLTIKYQLAAQHREMNTDPTAACAPSAFDQTYASTVKVIQSTITVLDSKKSKIVLNRRGIKSKS